MKSAWRALALACSAAVLLGGCATTYRIDNVVQAFSGLQALPANPTYRFERLPSQTVVPGQDQLEALADPALFRAGLRRDDGSPRYTVLVTARVTRVISPWPEPWGAGYGWGHGWGPRWGYTAGFGGPYPYYDEPWFVREVGVLVRDPASSKVVFESHATNDGPWLDSGPVLAAMFDAALQGFPNPPPGPRRIDMVLGGQQPVPPPAAPAATPSPAAAPVPSTPASAPAR